MCVRMREIKLSLVSSYIDFSQFFIRIFSGYTKLLETFRENEKASNLFKSYDIVVGRIRKLKYLHICKMSFKRSKIFCSQKSPRANSMDRFSSKFW